MRRIVIALVAGTACACSAVLGLSDLSFDDPAALADGATTGDAALAADAAPSIHCPLGCLPPAPAPWIGPSAVYDGDEATRPAGCPNVYTLAEVTAHDAITVPDAVCKCGSVTYTNHFCNVEIRDYSNGSCSGTPGVQQLKTSGPRCTTFTVQPAAVLVKSNWDGGTCTYGPGTTVLPPPTFGHATVSCGLPQVGACTDRADCIASPPPDAPFTRLCIHAPGDLACPSEDYAKKILSYAAVKEARTCADCSEAGVMTLTCGNFFSRASSCPGDVPTIVGVPIAANNGSSCQPINQIDVDIQGLGPTDAGCSPKVPAKPLGTATLDSPVTFCCNR
jgi:hypothetical protein